MEKTSKKLAVFSVLLATIITGIGVAFGYFIWNSTTNTDISFTVEGAVVQLDDGTDITGANLMPVTSYTSGGKNVVKKDIKIKLKDTTTDTVSVDFKLKVNSIDSGLNHSSFMYNLVNASGTSVKSGNFSTSKAGDTISLLTLGTTDGSLTTSLTSYTLYIYIDGVSGDNPSSMQNQSFDFSLDITGSNSSVSYIGLATEVVKKLDDGTTGDSGTGVYKVEHDAISASQSVTDKQIPSITDYRYYGKEPNNYVCLDMEGQSSCPDRGLFKIIGSIYEENAGTNLIKVIKATPLTDGTTSSFSWDYKSDGTYTGIWSTSTSGIDNGSTLMKLLNGIWLNREQGNYYNNSKTPTIVNFTDYGLTDNVKNMLNTSRYYLGSISSNINLNPSSSYICERTSSPVDNGSPYWDGMIGLMYLSDYGYSAGSECSKQLTLYFSSCSDKASLNLLGSQYMITAYNNSLVYVLEKGVFSSSVMWSSYFRRSIFPVFYLDKDVSIVSGTGTSTDPYILTK